MPPSFVAHLHPRTIYADTARFTLSFGLGGICATLLLLLFATGVLQLVSYSPQMDEAYNSILQMYQQGNGAGFIRNVHYWSGNLLVIVTGLHLLRVFLTGGLGGLRKYNWLIGIVLLLLALFANFTGYLLPWDQLAYWAVTIFTAMLSYIPFAGEHLTTMLRGGAEVGPATLSNFIAIHVGLIPALMLPLLIYHFWLIRKAGGLIRESKAATTPTARMPTSPNLIEKEGATALGVSALVLLFSAFVDAPLGEHANPSISPNPAKAAWYFMGLQELLLHLHPVVAICIIPLLMVIALSVLPFLKGVILPGGSWLDNGKGWLTALWSTVAGFALTVVLLLVDNNFVTAAQSPEQTWIVRGLAPLAGLITVLTALYLLVVSKGKGRPEGVMAMVLFTVSIAITLTAAGIWFRGPGMTLILPF